MNKTTIVMHSKLFINKKIQFITKVVADYFDQPIENFHRRTRNRHLINAKHIAIYLCVTNIRKVGYAYLASNFKMKHCMVSYIVKKTKGFIEWDRELIKQLKEIQSIIDTTFIGPDESESDYYILDLNNFSSLKTKKEQIVVLSGIEPGIMLELQEMIKVCLTATGDTFVDHENTGMTLINKNKKEA